MRQLLFVLGFLLTTAIQVAVMRDIYAKLKTAYARDDEAMEILTHYATQQSFIESTVLRHDEEITTLKAVCDGK